VSWLDASKSEHIIRREHFVAGVETGIDSERERIIESLRAYAGDESLISVEVAIALIKGMSK
jgi:hypothetical protein